MKILIASDHAGLPLKDALIHNVQKINSLGHPITLVDLGTQTTESVDYPDYANRLCEMLIERKDPTTVFGVLICGSGVGVSIAANRFPKIRAVLAESETVAKLAREHNHANVLCMGARIVSTEKAIQILNAFLTAIPDPGERHLRRIEKLGAHHV